MAATWSGAERWAGMWMFICEMKLSRSVVRSEQPDQLFWDSQVKPRAAVPPWAVSGVLALRV